MTEAFRIVLLGFSEFERRTLASCFRLASSRVPRYQHVQQLADADFVVADADHTPSVQLVAATERLAQTVFIGWRAPPGSIAWMNRPIDPLHVMRELDAMVDSSAREAAAQSAARVQPHEHALGPVQVVRPLPPLPSLPAETASADVMMGRTADGHAPELVPEADVSQEPAAPELADAAVGRASDAFAAPLCSDVGTPAGPAPADQSARAAPTSPAAPVEERLPGGESVWPVFIPDNVPAGPQAGTAAVPAVPETAARPRALLVDDSDIALRFLESRLKPWGLALERAGSSERALERLAAAHYEFVFLDVELGDASPMDGLALCQHIKRRQAASGVAVFLVSAHQSQLDRARGNLAGCDGYLGKPLQEAELERLLKRHGLRRSPAAQVPAADGT
jgi:CheY-like chemotaxis protein